MRFCWIFIKGVEFCKCLNVRVLLVYLGVSTGDCWYIGCIFMKMTLSCFVKGWLVDHDCGGCVWDVGVLVGIC